MPRNIDILSIDLSLRIFLITRILPIRISNEQTNPRNFSMGKIRWNRTNISRERERERAREKALKRETKDGHGRLASGSRDRRMVDERSDRAAFRR